MQPLTTLDDLSRAGLIDPAQTPALASVVDTFRVRVTPAMQTVIASDGVARQFVPTVEELITRPEELHDPIGDRAHAPVPGLTHRYPDRVILHVTQTCEVYCRFCFRRETVGDSGTLPDDQLDAALDYIARTPQIWEVILTGGDPLVLSSRRIARVMARLDAIAHVGVVRFHTRVPIVAPEKITDGLIAALQTRVAVYIVVHTNHADELTPAALGALDRLVKAGIPLLSQTVLLRGVNASANALGDLFRALIRARVKPYYLHHCDLALGTSHFRTTIAEGQAIMETLRAQFSGVCLPTYVLDIPSGFGKVPIGPGYVTPDPAGGWAIRDPKGGLHHYDDLESTPTDG
jgi:lysine 2,3-aminomutase